MLESLGNIASSIADIGRSMGEFAKNLNDRETWIRAVLVILGFGLLVVVLLNAR